MFGENGFGNDSTQTAGAYEPQNRCNQMNDENKQMADESPSNAGVLG